MAVDTKLLTKKISAAIIQDVIQSSTLPNTLGRAWLLMSEVERWELKKNLLSVVYKEIVDELTRENTFMELDLSDFVRNDDNDL